MLELVGGALIGLILSLTLQAYLRPFASLMERIGRRHFSKPILVHVEHDPSIVWNGEPDWVPLSVYIDDPMRMARINPLNRDEWVEQARLANAVDAGMTFLKATIQAKSDAAVVIESVRVVVHRKVQLDGGMILTRPTGGADLVPRRIEIDFDFNPNSPLVTWYKAGGEPGKPIAINLSSGEIEQFHIWAKAYQGVEAVRYEWSFELLLLVEGARRVHRIDDNGKPFVTVCPGNLPARFNLPGTNEWRESLG